MTADVAPIQWRIYSIEQRIYLKQKLGDRYHCDTSARENKGVEKPPLVLVIHALGFGVYRAQ